MTGTGGELGREHARHERRAPHQFRAWIMNEGDDYRVTAQRLRAQAAMQRDRAISEQLEKIAQRYDELAE